MPNADPVLIALDWGTSSLRAFLMAAQGRVVARREGGPGITALPQPGPEGFAAAFTAECGAWLARWPGLPVVAGGMVGSAQGWREAPYVACPADLAGLAQGAVAVEAPGARILIAPGVLLPAQGDAAPDVMRGEEIQLAGALAEHPSLRRAARFVMPGTHSKWVSLRDGRITGFATHMTGELFAVLRRHSLLGRLMPEAPAAPEVAEAAFARGLRMARESRPGDLPHQIFAARSLGLTAALPPEALADFLSGLLIGHELLSGLARGAGEGEALALIGEAALCARYEVALRAFGAPPALRLGNTAPAGLYGFAAAAGLVPPLQHQEPAP